MAVLPMHQLNNRMLFRYLVQCKHKISYSWQLENDLQVYINFFEVCL